MLPPVMLVMAILLMILVHAMVPLARAFDSPCTSTGFAVILMGILTIPWAVSRFRKAHTTIDPLGEASSLVTSGPYSISRNPMYLGMLLILAGLAISLGTVSTLFVLPLFIGAVTKCHIAREENNLERIFGDRYLMYRRSVRRWI